MVGRELPHLPKRCGMASRSGCNALVNRSRIWRLRVGVVLLPDDETPLSIWVDGYLIAWEGNPSHWPANDLDVADGTACALIEAAADWRPDTAAMSRTLPPWLRCRFHRQASLA